MSTSVQLPLGMIPKHVAVIMDGNGRWARQRKLPRLKGHEEGAKSVEAVVRACREAGVQYLTLYAFSTENWSRDRSEIAGLMKLLTKFLRSHETEMHKNEIRLRVIGRLNDLPLTVRAALKHVMTATRRYTRAHLTLALSYGARDEITQAARQLAQQAVAGSITPELIDETSFAANLYTAELPDPDLLIRTSGEQRLSNFLLWQLSYTELYFTEVFWPDFREPQFHAALREYASRQRRFGGTGMTNPDAKDTP